jgi:hypothetical protein
MNAIIVVFIRTISPRSIYEDRANI